MTVVTIDFKHYFTGDAARQVAAIFQRLDDLEGELEDEGIPSPTTDIERSDLEMCVRAIIQETDDLLVLLHALLSPEHRSRKQQRARERLQTISSTRAWGATKIPA